MAIQQRFRDETTQGVVGLHAIALWLRHGWFLTIACAIFALPSLLRLAEREWSTEQGAGGPIILASGLWLLWREARSLRPSLRTPPFWTAAPFLLILTGYGLGRILGILWLEWLSVYATLVWLAYAYVGAALLKRLWFPLVYLLILVPPPYALIAPITHSRKLWLSTTAVDILSTLGYDVGYRGTTLYIDQYELLVADACAGMNSLISLLAVTLFYVYVLHRAHWRYAILLAALTAPVAMFANLVRVMMLMLVTHYLGVTTAEGPLHEMAGMLMFLVALTTLIGVDLLLAPLRRRMSRA